MGKTRVFIPAAFISTVQEEDEVMRLGCSTYLEMHEVSTKQKGCVNLINAPTIECAKQLFMTFQMPVYNGRLFEIWHPTAPRMTALKLGDSDCRIIMLDSALRIHQAINYVHKAREILSMRSELEILILRAEAMMTGQSIATQLRDKNSPYELVSELKKAAHRCESLFADLADNFRQDLCV